MIINQTVQVKINANNIQHFKKKGYDIPMKKVESTYTKIKGIDYVYDIGALIDVKPEDLLPSSKVQIDVICDYCGEYIGKRLYCNRYRGVQIVNKDACKKCKGLKIRESNLITYGVESVSQIPEYQEKMRETNLKKYGVPYYAMTDECKEIIKKHNIEKYGVDNPMKLDSIKEKVRKTNLERTGYEYNLTNPIVREQIKETCRRKYGGNSPASSQTIIEKMKKTYFERHGADCSSHCPEVQDKIAISLYNNQQCKTSRQQLYLHKLYGGILNFPISRFNVDICIDNYVIEFDGGGHNLAVKTGKTSQEDFNKRMIARNLIIKKNGYKLITIISLTDKLPSDEILLDILEQSKKYFKDYPNHSWREWDIDNGIFRDAEHKDGESYDYGLLRKIK